MGVQDNTDKIEIWETNSSELGIHGPNSVRISVALWDLSLLKQVVDPICDNCAINSRQAFMALAVKIQRKVLRQTKSIHGPKKVGRGSPSPSSFATIRGEQTINFLGPMQQPISLSEPTSYWVKIDSALLIPPDRLNFITTMYINEQVYGSGSSPKMQKHNRVFNQKMWYELIKQRSK